MTHPANTADEPVSREPLRTLIAGESNDHRLRRRDENVLALESRYDAKAIVGGGIAFALLGGVASASAWVSGAPYPFPLVTLALFLAGGIAWVVVLGLFHPLRTVVAFDRVRGVATFRGIRFTNRPTLPWKAIVAVQICGPVGFSDWKSYQLNLVLAEGTKELGPQAMRKGRVNLLDNGALDELLFMGWKLAGFLDVPFLDHRAVEEEKAATGPASQLK